MQENSNERGKTSSMDKYLLDENITVIGNPNLNVNCLDYLNRY